jgi:MraZ protein
MFQGSSAQALDAKGRMTIPQAFRDVLLRDHAGEITLTRHPKEDCLVLYPRAKWLPMRERINGLPAAHALFKRRMIGAAEDIDLDDGGRMLVSQSLRDFAKLGRELTVLGQGDYLEIWDKTAYTAYEAQAAESADYGVLADLIM